VRVHLTTLGCRLNEAEIESWSRQFLEQGHQITQDEATADLVVVNTCAVTEEAVRKSRKLLRRSQRASSGAKLVVSGCYASLESGEAAQTLGVDLVIANRDKDRLVEITSRELDLPSMPQMATEPGETPLFARGRQRAFLKIQDGCRYRCSYCIVTLARGEERSRPVDEVVTEVNRLHQDGVREVVLTGVHIGGYGDELGTNLPTLIRVLLQKTDIERLRVGSLEPWDLPPEFWGLFKNPRFMPHLHLPLQSGSDTVLRRMARRCRSEEFVALVHLARQRVADFNVTTDLIVGFPGETDAEWRETLERVAEIGFGHLHIFAFSARAGTRAASLPDPVPEAVKRSRSQQLHALGRRLKRDNLERYAGRRFPVLVEGESNDRPGHWFGYTPNYLPVLIRGTDHPPRVNEILEVALDGVDAAGEHLLGVPANGIGRCPAGPPSPTTGPTDQLPGGSMN